MIYIHNKSGLTKLYLGTEILDDTYFLIPDDLRITYAESDELIQDISDGSVFLSYDSITDETGISTQIDMLKDNVAKKVAISENKPFSDAKGFRARFLGKRFTATKNSTTDLEYDITEERFINGVRIVLNNHSFGDSVKLQVVDKNYTYAGILYPADYSGTAWSVAAPNGVVLDEFGTDWYAAGDIQCQPDIITPYPARLLAGMTIRIVYDSIGLTDDVDVCINYYLHWKAV